MALETVKRPIDVVGHLPEEAVTALADCRYHRKIKPMQMAALTYDTLNLQEIKQPTWDEKQAAQQQRGVVLFFHRPQVAADPAMMTDVSDLDVMIRLFARGVLMSFERAVLYIGSFEGAGSNKVRWIGMPDNVKNWFGNSR